MRFSRYVALFFLLPLPSLPVSRDYVRQILAASAFAVEALRAAARIRREALIERVREGNEIRSKAHTCDYAAYIDVRMFDRV